MLSDPMKKSNLRLYRVIRGLSFLAFMRKKTGSKSLLGLFLITAFFYLATHQPLAARTRNLVVATLSASDATPNAGDTITLTASFDSYLDKLADGAIYDLGAGNNNGQTGGTIIGSSATLSGLRATVVRSFTIPSGTAAGSYTFRARAEDINGVTQDAWLVVTVQSSSTPTPNQAPTVSLSARDTTINEDGSTTLTASASDSDGAIVTYAFSRGSTLVQSGPLNTYKYTNPTAGTHRFTVTVTDDDGATATSSGVSVRVNPASVQWADINADGIFDRILATLTRPPQSLGGISSTTVNGVDLEIEEEDPDPLILGDQFLVSIRVPSSLTPVGFNYQFQNYTTVDSWVNAGPARPGAARFEQWSL